MTDALDVALLYHRRTKHKRGAYARGPGRMDWANEPNPFRRYPGSKLIELDKIELDNDKANVIQGLSFDGISRLFYSSLAISAWKSHGGAKWSLRVNPSSGDLHPTEGYLISGPVEGIGTAPGVYHYSPQVHGLELLNQFPTDLWKKLGMADGAFLVGLSSINWRESWKYGERAFRYCMLDIGHSVAALSIAASCLGWRLELLDDFGTDEINSILAMPVGEEGEVERADCILGVYTKGNGRPISTSSEVVAEFKGLKLQGEPNRLSEEHALWSIIEEVSEASTKPRTSGIFNPRRLPQKPVPCSWCKLIRKRRSAQSMDGSTSMERDVFYRILEGTLGERNPFDAFPWKPMVNLVLFVHRVEDLDRGVYLLIRSPIRSHEDLESLKAGMRDDTSWDKPEGSPEDLELYKLMEGDARQFSNDSSCQQDIASGGCFCAAMLAEFEEPLKSQGPWFYPRLHWECGAIGQALYLGAEASGFRGCGMGCFLDDMVPDLLGVKAETYQDLYHFTVGKHVEDKRLITLPAYD